MSELLSLTDAVDTAFFKALAEPTRIDVLSVLMRAGGEASMGRIAEGVSVDPSVVSRHLRELARVGVVTVERRGRERWYRLDADTVAERLQRVLAWVEAARQGRPCC